MILFKFPIIFSKMMKEKGISQRELAEKLGTTQPTVNRWLKGEYQPSLENLVAICGILDTTPNEILGYEKNSLPFGIEVEVEKDNENSNLPDRAILVPMKNEDGKSEIQMFSEEEFKEYVKRLMND